MAAMDPGFLGPFAMEMAGAGACFDGGRASFGRERSRSPLRVPPGLPPPVMMPTTIGYGAPGQAFGPFELALRDFMEQNCLDAAAEHALLDLPIEAQQRVLEEGPCLGSNKSAVLISRIRRITGHVPGAGELSAAAAEFGQVASLERFIRENDLDSAAVKALIEVPPDIQWKVVSEGMVTGRNRSAILIGRVRRALSGGTAQVPQSSGSRDPGPGLGGCSGDFFGSSSSSAASAAVERFVRDNDLDGYAEKTLREQSAEVQAVVIAEGPVTGENKSKILMGRVRRAQQQPSKASSSSALFSSASLSQPPPPQGLPPPGTEAYSRLPPLSAESTEAFSRLPSSPGTEANIATVQAAASAAFMQQYSSNPWGSYWAQYVQLGGTQALGAQPATSFGTLQPAPFMPGQPPPPLLPFGTPATSALATGASNQSASADDVEDFIRQNGLDSSASRTLRDQRIEVQLKVIGEGFLTGANKSAVLMSRVRRVVEQIAREQALAPLASSEESRRETVKDPISSFIRDNNLDAGAGQALREQPQSVQKRVLDEGPITGTNRSAILISRIRRIQQTPF